jgi:D-lactate dehydrogenase
MFLIFLEKTIKWSIKILLINTARGELQDNEAILEALQEEKLAGFGTDVFANEQSLFFKEFKPWETLPDPTVQMLVDMYPRVLVTPHVGSNTDEALSNMIETSYENFNEVLTTGETANKVVLV